MTKKRKMLLALSVLALIAAIFTGCETYDAFYGTFIDRSGETYDTVKIGVYEPLSGSDKEYGEKEVLGIELAHELRPLCMGKEVELVYADNKSDIYVAEEVIKELIEENPAMILGSYGSVYSLVAGKYIMEAEIPTIAITNTNPLVTLNNPYYFRVCYVDSYQGIALAKYAVEELGLDKAAVLKPASDDAGTALASAFEDKFVQMSGSSDAVPLILDFETGKESYKDELAEISASGAKTVFLPASEADAVKIINEANEEGLSLLFLGTEGWDTDSFAGQITGGACTVCFTSKYDPDINSNVRTEIFLKAYHEKYGEDAVPDSEVALGFDAYLVAIDALDRIGTVKDKDLLLESLHLTSKFEGASGSITLDSNGDPMRSVGIKAVYNGKTVVVYTMEPNIG